MAKPSCFIASAFGHADVDDIYDRSVIPALKALDITPLRVDRINHNNKIDAKIIELINNCDFGIADLTFARPSVYYEAGFIEGLGKQVIYIARRDHFKPKEKDPHGIERIHFDLITKNIIEWSSNSVIFQKRLRQRVQLILKSIDPGKKLEAEESESRERFSKLSPYSKRFTILDVCNKFALKNKFKPLKHKFKENLFARRNIRIHFDNTSHTLRDIEFASFHSKELSDNFAKRYIAIFSTPHNIPKQRIEKALPHCTPIQDKIYQYETVTFIFIDRINSLYKLDQELQKIKREFFS
jgi:hypothetical protein